MSSPKVSVCVVTYNQEALIEQCLRSILDQQVSFPIEVIVSDDASTDATPEIIRRFHREYPDVIRPFLHEKNISAGVNFQFAHNQATGEYVAHCDGDDYFLPGKLQRQVDYLDTHPGCVQVWHRQRLVDHSDNIVGQFPYRFPKFVLKRKLKLKDLAVSYGLVGQHSSQMYRRTARSRYDENVGRIDYFYALDIGSNGYSTHLDEFLGAYRTGNASTLTTTSHGKRFVERALTDTALFFTGKFKLGKQFYGNLWARRTVTIYEKAQPSAELEDGVKTLAKYKSLWYKMKSLKAYFLVHSSLNFFRIVPRYLKSIAGRIKNTKKIQVSK